MADVDVEVLAAVGCFVACLLLLEILSRETRRVLTPTLAFSKVVGFWPENSMERNALLATEQFIS